MMKIILSDCQRKNPGQVFWLTSQSNEAINTLQQPNNLTINFAIVTHKCFIEEARILFNNHAHIYTFKEIKGLQFKRVLAYRVFDHAIFRLASALLGKNKGSTHFIHRPKEGVGDAGFYPWFHLIFMAFTRAMATLFIYHHDDEDRELKYLLQPLKDIILNEKTKEASIPTDSRPSTSKEWLAEYEKLKQFNPEQAAVILNQQTAKFDFAKIAEKQTKAQETLKKGKAKKKQTRRKKEPTLPVLPEKESVSIPDKIELKLLKTFLRRCSVSALKKIVLHKNAANMLFSHEFCHRDGTNKMLLIDFICVNSKAFNAFRQFVESQEYQSRMFDLLEEALSWPLSRVSSMDLPIPPIYWLVRTYSLMLILKKLFENRPGLVKKIDPHTIGWMDKRTTEFEKDLSALYYLSSLPISQSILAQVVMHDPLLASQSMATALMHSLHEKNGIRKNTSPFYLLSRSIPGQTLLRIFLENVPSIAPRVFKLLFLTCNVKEAKCPVSFPLSEMARTDEGIAFLLKLLELYPQFAQEIRTEQLCLMFTVAAGKKKYAPPLYYLSKKAAGIDFLDKLFCLNSTLVNPTFMKTLCRTRHELIGEGKHISGLEFMCRTAGGPQFLNKILTQHRHLALYFSSDFLYKHHELGSLFFKFTSDPIGLDILTRLFVDNADLLIQFPSAALCQSVYISGVGEINSLLYLSSTPTGRSLLYYMLANRPDLLKEITGVALCLPLTKEAGSNENKSALYYLSQDSLGISIISKILQANSDFITQISPKALCRQLPEAAGKCQNAFALHHLFRNQTDAPLVFIFLEKIAALENHMTAALLCQVLDDFGDDVVNASLIYYLSMSVPGLKFLLRLLESHPEVAVGITAADLCRPFSQILNLYDNTNVIYFLTLTPLGCSVFSKLLDLNPDLAKQMTAQGLCHLRPENAGPYQNCSVLSNFSATPEGQHLYERILQDNPGLPAEIVLNKDAMATIKSFPYVAQLPGLKIMENLLWFQQGLESTFYREEPIDYPLSESMEILASTSFLFFPPQRIHKQKAQSECSEVKSVNACN